jgi:7,8-dihydropterin-6-yl-methyl-4-(beta-D-ribofuranosyl)aminobenzene 5'-phosphate synthase
MNSRSTVVAVAVAVLLSSPLALSQAPAVRITYLYDNTTVSPAFQADWGFACLIEAHGRTVLFDTGTKPDVLRHNLATLKIDIRKAQALVFSHPHGDHTLGAGALPAMTGIPAYLGHHFRLPPQADTELARIGVKRITVPADGRVDVFPGIAVGPEMFAGGIYEMPLTIDTPSGLIVVVGCSHPGIVDMLKRVTATTKRPVHAVIGGMHLMQTPPEDVRRIIAEFKALGVAWAGPTHCTGPEAIRQFREAYGDHFIQGGAGAIVTLPKDAPAGR